MTVQFPLFHRSFREIRQEFIADVLVVPASNRNRYERSIKCTMPGFFLLSYNSFNVDYKNIVDFCSA